MAEARAECYNAPDVGSRRQRVALAAGTKLGPYEIIEAPNLAMPLFDVTPDGDKFVVVTSDRPESSSITLVTNWTALLKKQ